MSYTETFRERYAAQVLKAGWLDEALADVEGLDQFDIVFDWHYVEPLALQTAPDQDRRAAALEWLARHNGGIQAIARCARRDDMEVTVAKESDDIYYGLSVSVFGGSSFVLVVAALVPAALTCEMRPTGAVETIPATEAREVPVMKRVCPESIFAGVQDEVTA